MVRNSRIILSSTLVLVAGQREEERSASVERGLRPGSAAMAAYDATHRGEADTGAGEFRRLVQPLEYAKQFFRVGHVEADSVVPDPERPFERRRVAHADLDDRFGARGGVFDRVVDQILPDQPDHVFVGNGD